MKRTAHFLIAAVITTGHIVEPASAQSNAALEKIAIKYKACINRELEASDNGDGTYDETFFLEGKAHCDKIKALRQDTAVSKERISQMTDDLISGAKRELGLK